MTHPCASCQRARGFGLLAAGLALLALLACIGPTAPPEAILEKPVTPSELVSDAEEAEARGDLDTAIARYRQAWERDPGNDRLRRALAAAYVERARQVRAEKGVFGLEAAERDLRKARVLAPEDPAVRQSLAALLADRATREMSQEKAQALRDEARQLDEGLSRTGEDYRPRVERRLDLAFELVERGQIDAGIERLEAIHNEHPGYPAATRLLGRSLARKALLRAERGRHAEAGALLDRSVGVYAQLEASSSPSELRDEVRAVHHNRIVAWLNAARPEDAQRALAEAEQAGFRFPELARVVGESAVQTR
jgi:tetratricopeptide (TPR) repeat protein